MEPSQSEEEWNFEWSMNIKAIRLMYSHICYSIEMWPGAPARPAEEQEFLHDMKRKLFAMITEYNFYHGE